MGVYIWKMLIQISFERCNLNGGAVEKRPGSGQENNLLDVFRLVASIHARFPPR